MNKTIKQMADIMGINKLRIYRFIDKKDIKSSKKINGSKTYDKGAQKLIYQHFNYSNNNFNDNIDNKNDKAIIKEKNEFINFIKNEIKKKDNQINYLQKMLDQQQQLSLQDKNIISDQKQKLNSIQTDNNIKYKKNSWWKFWI